MSRRIHAGVAALALSMSTMVLIAPTTANAAEIDFEQADAKIISDNPFKGVPAGIFIVTLGEAPVASYTGGTQNLRATSPQATGAQKLDTSSPAAVAYRRHLELTHAELVDRMSRDLGRTVRPEQNYFNANNGFATFLTAEEAARVLRMPGVANVAPEVVQHLDTDSGPGWIGAPGVWDGSATGVGTQGEGVIVGILDTGINPANPSFAEVGPLDGHVHVNPYGAGNFVGVCNPAETGYQPDFACNNKLVGAWNFTNAAGPTDDDGHGSHTASTAAGNRVLATVEGPAISTQRRISGVAPHANIIAYDVCVETGCPSSSTIAAIDQAIVDGVDVINFSIGSSAPEDPWSSPTQQAFLNARAAGIFVATSAGNNGPDEATVGSPAPPWMTIVAAMTHDRRYPNGLSGMTGGATAPPADMSGFGFTAGYGPAPIVYAGDVPSALTDNPELCGVGAGGDFVSPWPPGTFNGEIVVCDRGTFERVEKGANVLAAGAGGYVLADDGSGLIGDAHRLPAVHISQSDGTALKAWLASGTGHMAVIDGATLDIEDDNGDIVADFSSRGPNRSADFIVPSLGAPGVDIIAADGVDNEVVWGFKSGTSMSSPHVAGAGALLKALEPSWSPAAIESALMTTANPTTRKEDGATRADWFDVGAGRIQVAAAARAGLVLDETIADYTDADPAAGGDPRQINLASLSDSSCVATCSWTRTVTATVAETWKATAAADGGVVLTVEPTAFTLAVGESQTLTITADVTSAPADRYHFGVVELEPEGSGGTNGGFAPLAHLPVAIQPSTGNLPDQVHIQTRRNAGSQAVDDLTALAITDLTVTVNGLARGERDEFVVDQDSDNGSPYDDLGDGVFLKTVAVPAATAQLVAEILASEAPDLDLFVGRDLDGDGPEQSEEICASTSPSSAELCQVDDPAAGDWWVLVQNWAASPAPPDATILSTAVVGGDAGNMTVAGPSVVPELEPFDLRVFWDIPDADYPDRYYGSFAIGTDPANPGNIGRVPVILDRHEDDVTKTASTDVAAPGDTVTYTITVRPNVTPTDLTYTISDTIPDGMTYVEGSATGGATVSDGVVEWSGVLPSPTLADQFYVMSTSANDAMCDTGFGGYVNLEDFGILPDPGVVGDTVAFLAFTSGDQIEFYGESYTGMGFADDGFAVFDPGTHYAGQPWIPQAVPDPAAPNNLAAMMWHDFELIFDAATNAGVSLATAGAPAGHVVVEYDDVREFGGADGVIDFEIVMARHVDDAPGSYEIVYAFDNLRSTPNPVTVGVEDADGSEAVALLRNEDPSGVIDDGFQVCFDWQGPSFDPITIEYMVSVDDAAVGLLTNAAVHDTDDPGSQPRVASVDVMVGTPAAALQDAKKDIKRLIRSADVSDRDRDRLRRARNRLRGAQNPALWVSEETLVAGIGRRVMNKSRKAVNALQKVDADVSTIISQVVMVNILLAEQAVADASRAGVPDEDLAAAQKKLRKARRAFERDKPQTAIKRAKRAWNRATRYLR